MAIGRPRKQFASLVIVSVLVTCLVILAKITYFSSAGYDHGSYSLPSGHACKRKGGTPGFNATRARSSLSSVVLKDTIRKEVRRPAVPDVVTSSLNDNFVKRHKKIQRQRTSHVQKICQMYHRSDSRDIKEIVTTGEKKFGSFLVDDEHKIMYCSTPKVAGTTWKRVFNVLTGLTNSTSVGDGYETVEIARKIRRLGSYLPAEIDHIVETYTKFMFARHPFSRLLSAFNNKLAPNATDVRHRQEFREAVGEIIKLVYRPCAYKRNNRNSTCEYDISFQDFVRFLNDPRMEPFQNNVHWLSNYETCLPCTLKYDIIGKYESLLDDANYILKATKVDHIVRFPVGDDNAATSTHSSSHNRLIAAFKQIPMLEIEALVRRFRMDFLLFNYPCCIVRILGIT